jgi:hypothetical protein
MRTTLNEKVSQTVVGSHAAGSDGLWRTGVHGVGPAHRSPTPVAPPQPQLLEIPFVGAFEPPQPQPPECTMPDPRSAVIGFANVSA